MPSLEDTRFSDDLAGLLTEGLVANTTITLQRNTHVYNYGDCDKHVYFIESGQVKTFTVSRQGRDCLLSLYGPGAVFGDLCVLHAPRSETASVMTTTTIVRRMLADELLRVLARNGMLENLVRHLALQIADQQELIASFVTMNCERRLAARILHLARRQGTRHPGGLLIEHRITQEEFASMVGTTRSRVGLFLKRFADAGLVRRTARSCLLVDEEGLAAYAEHGPAAAREGARHSNGRLPTTQRGSHPVRASLESA